MKNKTVLLTFLIVQCVLLVAQEPLSGVVEKKWDNGNLKEQANWFGGVIIGWRKFYDKEGVLMEQHTFNKADCVYQGSTLIRSTGKLTTYYESGHVASELPVLQMLDKAGQYKVYAYDRITGYDDTDRSLAIKFIIKDSVELNHPVNNHYEKYNSYYLDIFLLYTTRAFPGLNGSLQLYGESGNMTGEGLVLDGVRHGPWEYYYENGFVQGIGYHQKVGETFSYKVGKWEYFWDSGKKKAEVVYFSGGQSNCKVGYGMEVGKARFYNKDGRIWYTLMYPVNEDYNTRTDTMEAYYSNGKIQKEMDESKNIRLFNAKLNQYAVYEPSALHKSYYENGNLKSIGFYSKIPRKQVRQEELDVHPCMKNNNLKIGFWYYFNEAGGMTRIEQYDLCGKLTENLDGGKVAKEGKKYAKEKQKYPFNFTLEVGL